MIGEDLHERGGVHTVWLFGWLWLVASADLLLAKYYWLAVNWWLILIWCKRKILLAGWLTSQLNIMCLALGKREKKENIIVHVCSLLSLPKAAGDMIMGTVRITFSVSPSRNKYIFKI